MREFEESKRSWWVVAMRGILLSAAILALGYCAFELYSKPLSKLVVLAVAVFVAFLAGQSEMTIPRTKIGCVARFVLAFWGIMWLGAGGGAVIEAAGSVNSIWRRQKENKPWLLSAAADLLSICGAGVAYVLVFNALPHGVFMISIGSVAIPLDLLVAGFVLSATHLLIRYPLLQFIGERTDEENPFTGSLRFARTSMGHLIAVSSALLIALALVHFGVEFGFVLAALAVACNIAYKLHRRSLEQKTRQITEASRMHLATVEALATAIDARDQIGLGHVRRTQIYAVGLGSVLGLGEDEISALRTGALLHDIGKLAVPDHILNKPGKLTQAEMEKAKIHSSVGASILEKVGFPYPVVPTVKYHHEFWDGNGYPEGLKGRNIPLTARILSIADAYDALRENRPYRPARTKADACNFLRSRSGSQYDPMLVEIFLKNLWLFENEVQANGLDYVTLRSDVSGRDLLMDDSRSPDYVEQIKQANREVFTLYSLAREFSSSLDLDETLSLFAEKVAEFVPYDTFVVYLLDRANESATAVHAAGTHDMVLKGRTIDVGQGATGYVLKKGKAVENVDPALDFGFSLNELSADYRVMASLPLIAEGRTIGAVSLYTNRLTSFLDEHLRLLETISRIAADAINVSMQHAEAEAHALTDPMTGLPNSRSLRIQFEKEITRATRSDAKVQLLVMDLDGFKAVNDSYGHKVGDAMLKGVGNVIAGQLREYDFLARYGGDEFVAIIPETDFEQVAGLHHRIETAVNEYQLPVREGLYARVGISLGSASFPDQGESFDQLIEAADKAMYLAKAANKQRENRMPVQQPAGDVLLQSGTVSNGYDDDLPVGDGMIIELDETNILTSSAVN